jgi:hypothetical protein
MKTHQIAESIWFPLAHKILPLIAFLIFAIPGVILIFFLKSHKVSGAENYGGVIILLGVPAGVFIKLVLYALKANQRLSFTDGCAEVFYSWMLYLHFVPVLGGMLAKWAEKKKAHVSPFVVKNEDN